MHAALAAPPVGASQAELLRAFDLPIDLLQDAEALERAAFELVEDKAADRVRYVEIRWGPLLHTRAPAAARRRHRRRLPRRRGRARRRFGVEVRLIATALRSHDPADNVRLALAAAYFIDDGLTGFDLAGPEAAFPDPLLHRAAFEAAASRGPAADAARGRMGWRRTG